jgi:hypothetical protein
MDIQHGISREFAKLRMPMDRKEGHLTAIQLERSEAMSPRWNLFQSLFFIIRAGVRKDFLLTNNIHTSTIRA